MSSGTLTADRPMAQQRPRTKTTGSPSLDWTLDFAFMWCWVLEAHSRATNLGNSAASCNRMHEGLRVATRWVPGASSDQPGAASLMAGGGGFPAAVVIPEDAG